MENKNQKIISARFTMAIIIAIVLNCVMPSATTIKVAASTISAGSLDATFGNNGKVLTDFGNSNEVGNAVVLQSDEKIVAVGSIRNGGYDQNFALARYNSNGSPDLAFGSEGKVTTDFGIRVSNVGFTNFGETVAIQLDGRIVVAGSSGNGGSDSQFALARYNADGSLDTTFDADGKVKTDFGGGSLGQGWAIAIQPDGKIIVAGDNGYPNNTYCCSSFALARYNSNGSLDTTFDGDGKVTTNFSNWLASGRAVLIQQNGKILVAGINYNGSYSDFALARYNTNGSLDATFDGDGMATTSFGGGSYAYGYDLTLQPDGKIIVAGQSRNGNGGPNDYSSFALVRYNSDGSLDTTFDADGRVITDFGNNTLGWAVAIRPDGKFFVAGYNYASGFALARYNANGSLDTTFDTDGKLTSGFGTDFGGDVVLQPDGKIVLVGGDWHDSNFNNQDFVIARFLGDEYGLDITGTTGVAGAILSYTDGTPKTAISDGAGNYAFTVPYNWSGVVTPSKVGYSFSPASRSYTNVTTNKTAQNYTAVLIRYTISGNVGASGITLNYTDGTAKTAISQANGNYSFTVSNNWSGMVTPVPTCFTFTPTSKTYVNVLANQAAQNYTAVFNGASGCSNISIDIGGVNQGDYGVASQTSARDSYPINNGPVKATSPNAVPFLIAERDAWLLNAVVQSFSEMMGLPGNQVTDTYYFPWYNNVTMDTQLRFANLGNTSTDITVTIAGIPQTPITVAAGQSTRVSYPGINNGPVKVQSSGNVPIIVAERDAWLLNGVVQSFSEMMGLPANQLTDTYYFPWYNNVTMDTQLRFANLGVVPTDITVTIAGIAQQPITVAAGQSTRVSYPINNGPVKVTSTGGIPIIVAERDAWLINGAVRSFSEMMGLPGNQLTTTYHFPWYNNVTMDTQLRFANLGLVPTDITVTIAGVAQPPITVAPGVSTRVSYAGINNGPVKVQSSGGVPIIVAERDAWLLNGAVRSFSEMMGLPGNQLATTYYFPWYNNLTMDTQLRFAVP